MEHNTRQVPYQTTFFFPFQRHPVPGVRHLHPPAPGQAGLLLPGLRTGLPQALPRQRRQALPQDVAAGNGAVRHGNAKKGISHLIILFVFSGSATTNPSSLCPSLRCGDSPSGPRRRRRRRQSLETNGEAEATTESNDRNGAVSSPPRAFPH